MFASAAPIGAISSPMRLGSIKKVGIGVLQYEYRALT